MANAIRKDPKIKGIKIDGTECKISQYADDTTLFLDGSKTSLEASLTSLDRYHQISGLKMNVSKSEAMWIGEAKHKTDILFPEKNLKWVQSFVKALGVYFSTNEELSLQKNTSEKIEKIGKLIENWSLRSLTLFGKITVIKAFLASQLVYILTPLHSCRKTLKEINDLLFHFLWNGKNDKIKRKVMISDYEDGGAKMLDIISFNSALKTMWITKYFDNHNQGKWKNLFNHYLKGLGGKNAFLSNLSKADLQKIKINDSFTTEVLETWAEIHFCEQISTIDEFLDHYLWNNSLVRIGNKPISLTKWREKGITKISDFVKQNLKYNSLHMKNFKLNLILTYPTYSTPD